MRTFSSFFSHILGSICRVLDDVSRSWMAGETSAGESQVECSVCLSRLEASQYGTRKLPCHHLFHRECVDRWLALYRRTCPLCRLSVGGAPLCAGELDCGDELAVRFSAFLTPGY